MKIVVFDLDETLGYFVELGVFWDCLKRYLFKNTKSVLHENDFFDILELYPEFLRPDIINILIYLKKKKDNDACEKLLIYTNNQGNKQWTQKIISYFEEKLNYKLFDQVIAAFKINGKIVEIGRTSHDKSYNDFIKCTKLPKTAEICFIDDNYFPGMYNKNVYYINLKPYVHDLNFDEMLTRFKNSEIGKKYLKTSELNTFTDYMNHEFKLYNYTWTEKKQDDYEIDQILSKQLLIYLEKFFTKPLLHFDKDNETVPNKMNKMNRTKKFRTLKYKNKNNKTCKMLS
jgi:hypothetical protein